MSTKVVDQLSDLIIKGTKLAKRFDDGNITVNSRECKEWKFECRYSLVALYGKDSEEEKEFRKSSFPYGMISTLQKLEAREEVIQNNNDSYEVVIVTPIACVQDQILLNIKYSDLDTRQKTYIKDIFTKIKNEVQKPTTNWNNVKELLKRSFDYGGFKIAPEIVKFADAYYKAKGEVRKSHPIATQKNVFTTP